MVGHLVAKRAHFPRVNREAKNVNREAKNVTFNGSFDVE